jgi:ADP-ribose pyrophosphatase YjhB (NUDIX family)
MKINNTQLKIIKADTKRMKADSIIDCSPKADEVKVRSAVRKNLLRAKRLKFKSVAMAALGFEWNGLSKKAVAKIMAQEVLRHAKYDKFPLKKIIFVLQDKSAYEIFKKVALSYLGYIQHKLCQGPFITVDIIIELSGGIILIERSNPPFGWAIPGGFLDYGETLEDCARREAKEETGLNIYDLKQMHTYSDPKRDPRFQTVTTVFVAKAKGRPRAGDDAQNLKVVSPDEIKNLRLAFDHNDVLADYKKFREAR